MRHAPEFAALAPEPEVGVARRLFRGMDLGLEEQIWFVHLDSGGTALKHLEVHIGAIFGVHEEQGSAVLIDWFNVAEHPHHGALGK